MSNEVNFIFCAAKGAFFDNQDYEFGECISSHKSYSAAVNKKEKIRKLNQYKKADGFKFEECVFLVKADADQYKPKTIYKKIVKDLLKKDENEHYANVLNMMIDAKTIGEPVSGMHQIWIDELGLTFDKFKAKYEKLALKLRDESERLEREQADSNARRDAIDNGLSESTEICYSFPAVAGIQGGKAYYTASIPVMSLVKIFTFDEEVVPAEFRSQRQLNEKRAKAISDYVLDNLDSYVLPALTATVSKEMTFTPFQKTGTNGRIGTLSLSMDCLFNIVDGQHRLHSWIISLKEAKNSSDSQLLLRLKKETVSVQMYFDSGLQNSQQIFSDINSGMVRPSTSISALYNHRDPFNKLVLEVLDLSPSFKAKIDVENNTVGKKSTKLFSLVAVMKLVNIITGINANNYEKLVYDDAERKNLKNHEKPAYDDAKRKNFIASITNFISGLNHLRQWDSMLNGVVCGPTARNELITAQTVFLHGVAMVGHLLFKQNGYINDDDLKKLSEVDVMKASACWNNRCVVNGKMVVTTDSKKAIAGLLCRVLEIPMSDSIKEIDSQYDFAVAV